MGKLLAWKSWNAGGIPVWHGPGDTRVSRGTQVSGAGFGPDYKMHEFLEKWEVFCEGLM